MTINPVKSFPELTSLMRRDTMKSRIYPIAGMLLLVFSMAAGISAQDDRTATLAAGDLYVISAKAGGINYVEGTSVAIRADGSSGRIVKGDELDAGDVVETGSDSRVEILLNPGSFARLDRNTRFELATTDLNDLRLNVLKGSAIFEVFASDDFKVTVVTPKTEIFLVKSGVYRVDVDGEGIATLEVWRGRAETAEDADDTLKKGRTATLDGGEVEVAKFDRGDKDDFERWSRDRAELIAKANKRLKAKMLEPSLLTGFRSNVWDCWQSVGLWVYNPQYRIYSFLPFGHGWRSPYGFGIRTATSICYYPDYFYGRPYGRIYGGGGRGHQPPRNDNPGTNPGTKPVPAENLARGRNTTTPPFRRMQQSGGVEVSRRTSFPSSSGGLPPLGGSSGSSSGSSGSSSRATTPTSSSPGKSEPSGKGRGDN
ncbi:MAG: hypothetical protein DWQ47_17650 [Acidobacteria bacterium]|nr:MAG: hypothetical protein DWQ32_05050 [Acidobacteriota bacterium]REK02136.1 MAG: hypothetical protein DWQ38_07105 [Acidobacteriota bacterium]REK14062.1 MAG: hypothetical protein DWQ43_10740 [Acidobacteriota bacterium]REK42057.1 MAG: hypothetical protein DWQ47_17650 [Acidobacteriota bacterium]